MYRKIQLKMLEFNYCKWKNCVSMWIQLKIVSKWKIIESEYQNKKYKKSMEKDTNIHRACSAYEGVAWMYSIYTLHI